MRYFAYQGNDFDCGFASLKMLLCYAHKTPKYLRLAKSDEKRSRYSYRDLVDIAARHGVILTAYKLLDKEEIRKQKIWPLLVAIKHDNGGLHLVVLRRISRKVHIDDPNSGAVSMAWTDFIERWDGSFLQISKVLRPCEFNKEKPIIKTAKRFLLLCLQTFSALFALLGFAFVSSQSFFAYPLLFFALFIICELLFRRFQLAVLAEFDEHFMHRTYDEDKAAMRQKFRHFHDFKKSYFLFPQIVIGSLIIAFFALTILAINDIRHLIFLAILSLFALCDFFLSKVIDGKNEKILSAIEEDSFQESLMKSDVLGNYQKMSALTQLIAKSAITRKYVGLFLIGACALTYAAISAAATLNYFLFHFFIYLLFYENVGKLFSCLFRIDKLKREIAEFKDRFVR
jgi:predicted double-glycine peptidase